MALGLAVVPLGVAVGAAQQPAAAPAPASRACIVQIDSTGREALFVKVATRSGQDYQAFAGGGVFGHCSNEPTTTMQSDSLAWYPERNEAHFLRNVHFQDSTASMESDRLVYFVQQERLYAEGNVHAQNRRTRSDLRGPNLDYRRARPGVRDTVEMYATARPTIRFYSNRDSARADSAEPFVVVADRARMRGNDQMWGGGHVTIDRSDLAAKSDSASLDLAADRGVLVGGSPTVDGKGKDHYRLAGTRIQVGLTPSHDLNRVLAQGQADAVGPDWHLRADTIDAALDSGKVQRAQAWGRTHRPDALSGTYTIVADSLDLLMPRQVMREMRGYGNGRATNRPDSTVTEDDWMVGDTLHATFAPADSGAAPRARADSAARDSAARDSTARPKTELRRLTSRGKARALYHVVDEAHRDLLPAINYSRGQRIAIAMASGKVATVDVVGQVEGVYLEPAPRVDSTRADSTHADSTRADSARVRGDTLGAVRDSARAARPDTTRVTPPDTTRAPAAPRPAPADTTARPARPRTPPPVRPRATRPATRP